MKRLKVSENRRYLIEEDGKPFFYLGDTAWELFHRLDREEVEFYLQNRSRQKFTVLQAVVLAEHEYHRPNPYGHLPLIDNDPTKPNEPYFQNVDFIVERAATLGIRTGMLPTWGDKWNKKWGAGPELFTPENARAFGAYLGKRYKSQPILWILGGDRPVESDLHRKIISEMAAGLREGDGGAHPITFHPMGQQTSSTYFHNEPWLDFNMYQTGHTRNRDSYRSIAEDYARTSAKPCMDAEPGYEDHPNGFKPENGYLTEYDVRKSAYWALFAGAHGHTYGCHDIWQFFDPARFKPISTPITHWRRAVTFPGAEQMRHVRRLIESRPFLTRIPDQSVIVGDNPSGPGHLRATRDSKGSYAFVYSPIGGAITLDVSNLTGKEFLVRWFDPRNGVSSAPIKFAGKPIEGLSAPSSGDGCDWILIIDDASKGYGPP